MEHRYNDYIFKMYKEKEPPRFNKHLYVSLFAVNIAVFSMGTSIGWSSPALSKLNLTIYEENQLQFMISPTQEAGIVSLLFFGAVFGALFTKIFINELGRKVALLISGIPHILGFLCLATANNIPVLFIGRFFNGFAIGIILTVSPLYIYEISDISNRKLLNDSILFSTNLGCLFVYGLSSISCLKLLSMINVIFPITFMLIFGFMSPETPYYYVYCGKIHDAWDTLKSLRSGSDESIDNELVLIQREVVESFSDLNNIFDFIKNKTFRKKLLIVLGLIFCNQLIGITTIFCYMQSIFDEIKPILSPSICVLIMGLIELFSGSLGAFLISTYDKKLVLLISALNSTLIQIVFAIYLCLKQYEKNTIFYKVFPIVCISLLVWNCAIAFSPCINKIIKETFPSYANSIANSIETVFMLISTIVVTACFPFLRSLEVGYPFVVFGIFSTLTILFVYFFIPEQNTD